MSEVEDEVCAIIQARAKKVQGTSKYNGETMERDDLSHPVLSRLRGGHDEWLEHLQHELMDAVIYVQRLRTREQTLGAKLLDAYKKCRDFKHFGKLVHKIMLEEMYDEVNE